MKISIALATFNGEKYLAEQLASFVEQARPPDELVVCDDNSQDGTYDILMAFAETAPFPVRVFRNKQALGVDANFARAIDLAEGDLIFLSDQDDVWLPEKVARMANAFHSPDVMVVTCDQEATDEHLNPNGQSVLSQLRAAGAPEVMFTIGCCTAIRSSFRMLLLPLPDAATTYDFWLDALAKSLDVHHTVAEVLQYHRRHGSNASPDHLIATSRTGRLALLRRTFEITPDQKAFQYRYYEGVINRLQQVPESHMPLEGRRRTATEFAARQLATLRARHEISTLPRRRRLPGVVRLWRRGDYANASGWRSAVKDLVARRP